MKKSTLYVVLLVICIVALLATFVFRDAFEPNRTVSSFTAENVSYDSSNPAQIYRHLEVARGSLKTFQLSMGFEPTSISSYNNAFQTAPANSGLRLELSKPNTLALVAGSRNADGYRVYVISSALSLNQWHAIHISIDMENHITVNFDGKNIVDEMDPDLTYDISDVEIGTGLSGTRPFFGQIRNASFSYRILAGTWRITAFRVTFFALICFLLFLINGLDSPEEGDRDGDAEQQNGAALGKKDWPSRRFRGDEA